ncbi:TPA: hypothetical protein ACU8BS_001884 [Neisseria subflava]
MKTKTVLIVVLFIAIAMWGSLCYFKPLEWLPTKDIEKITDSIQSTSIAMLGFLMTVLALLASLVNQEFIKKMQKIGQFQVLLKSIFWTAAIFFSLVFMVFIQPFFNTSYQSTLWKVSLTLFAIANFLLLDIGKKFWFVFCGLNKKM